jgi:hypothetical protein
MNKKILIAVLIVIIAIIGFLAWGPWASEAQAKDAAKAAFEAKWAGVADGCSFKQFGAVEKKIFGYEVTINAGCGMILPGQEPQTYQEKYFISSFGTTTEIVKQVEHPPTKGPATAVPVLVISNFNFSEVETGAADFTYMTTLAAPPTPNMLSFEGPIMLSDPCHNLTAGYSIQGNTVMVNITAIPTAEICIQVIKNTFYRGSFEYTGTLASLIVNYQGQEIGGFRPVP